MQKKSRRGGEFLPLSIGCHRMKYRIFFYLFCAILPAWLGITILGRNFYPGFSTFLLFHTEYPEMIRKIRRSSIFGLRQKEVPILFRLTQMFIMCMKENPLVVSEGSIRGRKWMAIVVPERQEVCSFQVRPQRKSLRISWRKNLIAIFHCLSTVLCPW